MRLEEERTCTVFMAVTSPYIFVTLLGSGAVALGSADRSKLLESRAQSPAERILLALRTGMRSRADLGSVLAIQGARPIGGCSLVVRTGWATALCSQHMG